MNKYQNIKMRKIINYCTCITIMLVTFYTFFYCNKINLYKISEIEIYGNEFVDNNTIKKIVNNKIKNKNIFTLQTNSINNDITNNQFIQSSQTYTTFPATISIIINEIKPLALFEENSNYYLIDDNYKQIQASINAINYFSVPILSMEKNIQRDYNKLIDILKYTNINNIKLYKSIKEIKVSDNYIYFIIQDNTMIKLSNTNLENNIYKLIEFVKMIGDRKRISSYKYINLSIPNQIIVKEKNII